jgi:hypothetical protein
MAKQPASKSVTVANVRVNAETVQVVRFKFNAPRGTYIARSRKLPSIKVRPTDGGWVATAKGRKGECIARTPHKAFGDGAKAFWA